MKPETNKISLLKLLKSDMAKIKGEQLRCEVRLLIAYGEENASDDRGQMIWSDEDQGQVPLTTETHYAGHAINSIGVWLCEKSTSNAARKWFSRRGVAF